MRTYKLVLKTAVGMFPRELISSGDETLVIHELVRFVYEYLAKMLIECSVSVPESFDVVRGLEIVDKEALERLNRPTDKIRVPLIDIVYEITVVIS